MLKRADKLIQSVKDKSVFEDQDKKKGHVKFQLPDIV